ncbi:MAG: Zn-dependent hydrolase [Vicinamibacterales bacterium]
MTAETSTYADGAARVIRDLRSLAALTSTPDGAQRLAWTPVWTRAREWFRAQVDALGLTVTHDAAGNAWVTLEGDSPRSVIVGSHLDSVPNGGWLDGVLGVMAGLEVLRRHASRSTRPPLTLRVVDWADEEGARFGRSLLGSSAAAGTLDVAAVRALVDRDGTGLPDALAAHGVDLDAIGEARRHLATIDARAYLELHIEQGPVLESLGESAGVVIGTFGVERHRIRFVGQAAHSGSTPIPMRRDALLAAADTALACREIARRHSTPAAGVVCTVGTVRVEPGIVTAVPGVCEISLDQRALDADVLASMLAEAKAAAEHHARDNGVSVEWSHIWRIEPRPFDPALIELCEAAVRTETGAATRLPSGPLHDAAEMVLHMPVVMQFVQSSRGLSHCKEEDTPESHLAAGIRAFLRLVDATIAC